MDRLRRQIETAGDFEDENLRIIAVPQIQLWREGVDAGKLLAKSDTTSAPPVEDENGNGETEETEPDQEVSDAAVEEWRSNGFHYAAGKWGRFLRAPDIYFRIMREYGRRFVKLGEIADIRFGIKSGCDAFFMLRDVTNEVLEEVRKGLPWNHVGLLAQAKRDEVESGKVRIVRAGDNTLHPIETEYLRPEVHSLMQVGRPVVRAADTDRVVLWVTKELRNLSGTYAAKYIRCGRKGNLRIPKVQGRPRPRAVKLRVAGIVV